MADEGKVMRNPDLSPRINPQDLQPIPMIRDAIQPAKQSTPTAAAPEWTLWNEVHSVCSALRKTSGFCQETIDIIERRMRELERMLGEMPKRS